ncbi:cobalt ECF transporter T component CbiQ [Desulfuribacillus alkaliarsenatis]|uniref:Cobalt ECF transporter T component CbiQ n=1 Tax=Desulfuribacillus alkaliarsenatis TaxID=766136 RepID=A0A1E5G4I9_9FIRM|nr:cobalt ECF transporter T component CbiQ [Desulfuribacillus alkaliarsenatis]OEF98001.1 cobalt ECF transporter T component CbiQ [Desulfuribacillus alkaliarsenatis]
MRQQALQSNKWEYATCKQHHNDSWLYRWEPRTKIVAAVSYIILTLSLSSISTLLVAFSLVLFSTVAGKVPLKPTVKKISWLLPFLVLMAIPLLFGNGLQPTTEQYQFTGALLLKALTSAAVMIILLSTQSISSFFQALGNLKLPPYMTAILFLTFRYVFLFRDAIRDVEKALRSRNFKFKNNPRKYNTLGEVLGGMFVGAFDRSETLHRAMEARGFDGTLRMGPAKTINIKDLLLATIVIFIAILLILIDRGVLFYGY